MLKNVLIYTVESKSPSFYCTAVSLEAKTGPAREVRWLYPNLLPKEGTSDILYAETFMLKDFLII